MASPRAATQVFRRPGERRRVIENFTWPPVELRGYNLFSYLLPQ
jgi:hypothetical protein